MTPKQSKSKQAISIRQSKAEIGASRPADLGVGRLLDPGVRVPMESALGGDFSRVRVHDDEPSRVLLHSERARALAIGSHVLLPPGVVGSSRPGDRALLAHELTHVLQQRRGGPSPAARRDAIEIEARQVASAIARGTKRVAVREGTTVGTATQLEAEPVDEERFEPEREEEEEREALHDPRNDWRDGLPARVFEEVEEVWRELGRGRRTPPETGEARPEPLRGRPEPPVLEERGPLAKELFGSALPPWVARARLELERPVVTLERGGAPPLFITSLPERTQYFPWGNGRVPVAYRPRLLHVLDAIEWETPRAATRRDAQRALERYLGAWPTELVIEPLIPEMGPFFPPDLDPDGRVRRAAYERALAAGAKKRPATATTVEPPTKDREETRRRPATMRHQIQRGLDHHYASEDVTAADPLRGVTGLQLRAAMAANFKRYSRIAHGKEQPQRGWERGLVDWEGPLVGGIIQQSLAIREIINAGGITTAGNVRSLQVRFRTEHPFTPARAKDDESDEFVRLDVENQGHNLRSEV